MTLALVFRAWLGELGVRSAIVERTACGGPIAERAMARLEEDGGGAVWSAVA